MTAFIYFISGVAAIIIGDRILLYYNRYQRNVQSSMFEDGWMPPLRCILNEHKWVSSGLGVYLIKGTIFTPIETCARKGCGLGRMLTFQGFSYRHPKEVKEKIEREQAVHAGAVTPITSRSRAP